MTTKLELHSLFSRNVLLIALINMLQNATGIMGNVFVAPLGVETGLSATIIGAATSFYILAGLLCRAPCGILVDTGKFKQVMMFGILGRALVFVCMGLFVGNPWLYMILRVCQGITWSFIGLSTTACLGLLVDKKALGAGFAIFGVASRISSTVARPIAQAVYRSEGFFACTIVAAIPSILAALLILLIRVDKETTPEIAVYQKRADRKSITSLLSNISVFAVPILVIYNFRSFTEQADILFTSVQCDAFGFDPTTAYLISGAISTVFVLLVNVSCDFINPKWVTIGLLSCAGVGAIIQGSANSTEVFTVGYVIANLGDPSLTPLLVWMMKNTSKQQYGSIVATRFIITDIFGVFAGIVVGMIADAVGYGGVHVVTGILPLIVVVILILFGNKLLSKAMSVNESPTEKDVNTSQSV